MPRCNRIAFEGAHYHIFNRITGQKGLFITPANFDYFLGLLQKITDNYQAEIYAYCMMQNHYHIYLSTPQGNISDIMWYFGMQLARHINKHINSDGPLCKSRFRDTLVNENEHALRLTRYIHRNPVTAGLVSSPNDYKWSSYRHYLNPSCKPKFLNTDFILGHHMDPLDFIDFTSLGNDKETQQFYGKQYVDRIWGNSLFTSKFK